MPEELLPEYEARHFGLPLAIRTDREQVATAYVTAPTPDLAAFFGTAAEDSTEEERQTVLVASTMLTQLVQAVVGAVFPSASGVTVTAGDPTPDGMPAVLAGMDEPALALSARLVGASALPFTLVLPGTFLDVAAGALPAAGLPASPPPANSLPFTLTAEELDEAELLDEPAPARLSEPAAARPAREPTPISQAPTAHRARFTPLPDPEPAVSRQAMDLLAGLQMNVCVELGRTELTVADVLGLGPGSVVELDRLAGEPVDILVNDRLIARGEVVVVDENFGVRVVEVVRRNTEEERVS
ncbi:MAG: flagellar motor switch protein FliN [Dehalococcoidia bacterium]|nr:flagellar motor switch protein FliN [Dehalococcoidia bacterium]